MYHFMSGYTAKVAGTEMGITEPQPSLRVSVRILTVTPANTLITWEKLNGTDIKVWLVNTGWSGGAYGVGNRMKLSYTRSMITAAMNGELDNVEFQTQSIFDLSIPTSCPNIPSDILNPKDTWDDKAAFDKTANNLAEQFVKNFEVYEAQTSEAILSAAPKVMA